MQLSEQLERNGGKAVHEGRNSTDANVVGLGRLLEDQGTSWNK